MMARGSNRAHMGSPECGPFPEQRRRMRTHLKKYLATRRKLNGRYTKQTAGLLQQNQDLLYWRELAAILKVRYYSEAI
jgi:hypothetical protein